MNKSHNISKSEWDNCKKYFECSCAYCRLTENDHRMQFNQDLHKEHVNYEGENDLSNCIPSCKLCNSSKHTFELEDWYNKDNPNFTEERLHKIYNWLNIDYLKFKE